MTTNIDDAHFIIECRYKYHECPKSTRIDENLREEEFLIEEEEIHEQLEEIDINGLIKRSGISENYNEIHINVQIALSIRSNNQENFVKD